MKLFYHPEQPEITDYFEPWTYDYETLIHTGRKNNQPVARLVLVNKAKNGSNMGPNWDDDLAGGHHARGRCELAKMGDDIVFDYEEVFMRYLPRFCNHLFESCMCSSMSIRCYLQA